MKVVVINGTAKHGVTYRLKELFLEPLRGDADITEFYLPKDGPGFCVGCTKCFLVDESTCKDAACIQTIERALLAADLLVFTSPAYVFHATGAIKNLLDHLGYRWMPHRPAREMFGKRAVIITQCLGAGGKSAAKDIKDSLAWWGISSIKTCTFRLMDDIEWDKISEKRHRAITARLQNTAHRMLMIDYSNPARVSPKVKLKFLAVRKLQQRLAKENPAYADAQYWKANGWLDGARPWQTI